MALQPVAVGVNGEIGYVAVQQPNPESSFVPGQEMAMDHQNFLNNVFSAPPITSPSHHSSTTMINQNSVISGCTQGGGAFTNNDTQPSQEALRQESERMKHELEVLQKKISCLNTARRNNSQNGGGNFNFGTDDKFQFDKMKWYYNVQIKLEIENMTLLNNHLIFLYVF